MSVLHVVQSSGCTPKSRAPIDTAGSRRRFGPNRTVMCSALRTAVRQWPAVSTRSGATSVPVQRPPAASIATTGSNSPMAVGSPPMMEAGGVGVVQWVGLGTTIQPTTNIHPTNIVDAVYRSATGRGGREGPRAYDWTRRGASLRSTGANRAPRWGDGLPPSCGAVYHSVLAPTPCLLGAGFLRLPQLRRDDLLLRRRRTPRASPGRARARRAGAGGRDAAHGVAAGEGGRPRPCGRVGARAPGGPHPLRRT